MFSLAPMLPMSDVLMSPNSSELQS